MIAAILWDSTSAMWSRGGSRRWGERHRFVVDGEAAKGSGRRRGGAAGGGETVNDAMGFGVGGGGGATGGEESTARLEMGEADPIKLRAVG